MIVHFCLRKVCNRLVGSGLKWAVQAMENIYVRVYEKSVYVTIRKC
jgi:hypothetical protein